MPRAPAKTKTASSKAAPKRKAPGSNAKSGAKPNGKQHAAKKPRRSAPVVEEPDEPSIRGSSGSSSAGGDASSDAYSESDVVEDREDSPPGAAERDGGIDSDDLDAPEDEGRKRQKTQKRKPPGKSPGRGAKGQGGGAAAAIADSRKLVSGPRKDELVEPGIIAPYTMEFLRDLQNPECNDRDWFALHDARYRAGLANWQDFLVHFAPKLAEADWTVPILPPKDLVQRIYRDVRFSNDKTPYRTCFAAGFSRTGRKGPWAGYYLQVSPGGKSLFAGGKWSPEKNDLATIRSSILRNPKPLRKIISSKEFVGMFGKPHEGKEEKKRQNIFGHEDQLKNCPKLNGVTKDHPDIDLLKLRTIGAAKNFTDQEVLSVDFADKVAEVAKALAPLVQLLNDMILPQSDDENEDEGMVEEEEMRGDSGVEGEDASGESD